MLYSFRFLPKFAAVLLLLVLAACAGKSEFMRDTAPDEALYAPQPSNALVVFMRPSGLGFAVQSSVFDVTSGEPIFISIVSAKAKFAHQTNPGKRRFMVIGENADFMDATLDHGKVYYALVSPRMGLWKARFGLEPVTKESIDTPEFAGWYGDTRWVENLDTAPEWAQANMPSILEKIAEYLPDWEQGADKPMLNAEDGQEGLYLEASTD